jgi:hypothetical protein
MDEATPSPVVSTQQGFTIDKSQGKSLSMQEHANRVNRIVSTYLASSPEQQRSGRTWYKKSHRAAVTVAKGEDPGIGTYTPAMKRGVYRPPGLTDEKIDRAAGTIARLSPSMPAGMNWEHNAQAAYEVGKLTDPQVSAISHSGDRARYVPGNSSLHHAGEHAIVHAHAIATGQTTPEADLNQKAGSHGPIDDRKKAGSFYRNIKDPLHSTEVTVDARAVGIAAGHRVGFKDVAEQAGSMSGQRYKDYEHAYQDATDIVNAHLDQAGKTAKLAPHMVQATTWLTDKADLEKKMGTDNGGLARGSHLHVKNAAGEPLSHRDFLTPAGQERSNSA